MKRICFFALAAIGLTACKSTDKKINTEKGDAQNAGSSQINYSVVKRFAHDTTSFTEGLLVHNGQLFESTGHTDSYPGTRSLFGILDFKSGKISTKVELDEEKYFGEGIAFIKNKIYQLTYDTEIGFTYDTSNYKKTGEFHYKGEGWGFTTNGSQLIMSNGGSNIVYREPETFQTIKTLNVTDNNGPVSNVNELELINGFIYANEWQSNYILKIDTTSGKVLGKIDLSALKAEAQAAYAKAEETNGIAFDPATNKMYVTGKLWPYLYEIKLSN